MKNYWKYIIGLLAIVLIALFISLSVIKSYKPVPYSISFLIGEPQSSTLLNDNFIKILSLSRDSIKNKIYIPDGFHAKYFFKKNNLLDSIVKNSHIIEKLPSSIYFYDSYQKTIERNLRKINLDSNFLKISNLTYDNFNELAHANIGKKIILDFDADSIDVLIKKRDSILLAQPSSQFLIIIGYPLAIINPEIVSFAPASQSIKSGNSTQATSVAAKNADRILWKLFSTKGGTVRGVEPDSGSGNIIPSFRNISIVTGKNVELTFTVTPYLKNRAGKAEEYNISIIALPPPECKACDELKDILKDTTFSCYGVPIEQCRTYSDQCKNCKQLYLYCKQKFQKKGNKANAAVTFYGGNIRCPNGDFHSQLKEVVEPSSCINKIGVGK